MVIYLIDFFAPRSRRRIKAIIFNCNIVKSKEKSRRSMVSVVMCPQSSRLSDIEIPNRHLLCECC